MSLTKDILINCVTFNLQNVLVCKGYVCGPCVLQAAALRKRNALAQGSQTFQLAYHCM
jgi:hypothetical protein